MKKASFVSLLMVLCLVFSQQFLFAQSNHYPDVVELENGSILKCKILDYQLDGNIKVEILGGTILVYPSNQVKKIDRINETVVAEKKKEDENFHIYREGMFYQLQLDILGGLKDDSWGGTIPTLGLGAKFTAGKVLNRHLMLGGGMGWVFMDNTIMYSHHVPIYAEIRGDLLKRRYSFYYTASLGYNWALLQNNVTWGGTQMTAARGGVYVNPGLGIRFASRGSSHFCLEMGYSIHTASFDYLAGDGSTATARNVFSRPKISCAIMF